MVEDHDDTRVAITEVLTACGMDVVAVEDGHAALDALRRDPNPWCVVVLDWRMPRMDGEAFLTQLRAGAASATVPVVVCSGDSVTPGAVATHDVHAIVRKPIRPDTLLAVIGHACPIR